MLNYSSDFGVSAVGSTLGLNMSAYTVENASALEYSLSDKAINDMKDAIKSGEKNPNEVYGDALNNASDKITTTQETLNKIENTSAETLGLWSTNIPLFWTWSGIVTSLLGSLLTMAASWGLGKLLKDGFGGLVSSLKNGISTITGGLKNVVSNGAKGLVKGLSSPVAKVVGGIAGGIIAAKDAYGGAKKANEWFNTKKATTGQKVASGIGGALGGTGPGIGEEGASVGSVAKNVLGNAAKGAAIGTMFGPIGTAIGAGVGAITGAIGGKRIAKAASAIEGKS